MKPVKEEPIQKYDALILGNGLAGIVSAISLLEKRKKVAVVCLKDSIKNDVDDGEFLTSQLLFSYLQRAKILQTRSVDPLKLCDSGLQYVEQADKRFLSKIFFQTQGSISQLKRDLLSFMFQNRVHLPGDNRREIRQFMKAIETSGIGVGSKAGLQKIHTYKDELNTVLPYVFRVFPSAFMTQKPKLTFSEHVLWEEGLEDLTRLKRLLLNKVKNMGGKLISTQSINRIEAKRKLFSMIEVGTDQKIQLLPRVVIIGGRTDGVLELIDREKYKRRWKKNKTKLKPKGFKVSKSFLLKQSSLPVQLKTRGIWQDQVECISNNRRKIPRAFKYLIRRFKENEAFWEVIVSTYVLDPYLDWDRLERDFTRFTRQIIPFVEEQSSGLRKWTDRKKGDFQETALYEVPEESDLWPLQYRSCVSNMKNVFIANREVLPTLGVDGELITGLHAGQVALNKLETQF